MPIWGGGEEAWLEPTRRDDMREVRDSQGRPDEDLGRATVGRRKRRVITPYRGKIVPIRKTGVLKCARGVA